MSTDSQPSVVLFKPDVGGVLTMTCPERVPQFCQVMSHG